MNEIRLFIVKTQNQDLEENLRETNYSYEKQNSVSVSDSVQKDFCRASYYKYSKALSYVLQFSPFITKSDVN
jgi:hypothetical protein